MALGMCLLLSLLAVGCSRQPNYRIQRREADLKGEAVAKLTQLQNAIKNSYGEIGTEGIMRSLEVAKGKVKQSKIFSNVNVDNMKSACDGVIGALSNLQSSDAGQVAMGITSALSGISALAPPPVGVAMSAVLSVATSLIGVATGNNKGMSQIMDEVLKKALTTARIEELKDQIEGSKEVIENAMTLLNSYRDEDHSQSTPLQNWFELNYIGQQVKLKDGLPILGELISMIERQASKATNKAGVDDVVTLMRAYAPLASVRDGLLSTLYNIYSSNDITRTIEISIQKVIARDTERNRRLFSQYFIDPPAQFAQIKANFDRNAKENEIVVSYMKTLGLDVGAGELQDGCYQVESVDLKDHIVEWVKEGILPARHHLHVVPRSSTTETSTFLKFTNHGGKYTMQTKDSTDSSWDTWMYSYMNPTGILTAWEVTAEELKTPPSAYFFTITKIGGTENTYYMVNQDYPGYPVIHGSKPIGSAQYLFVKGEANPGKSAYWNFNKVACP